MVAGTSIEKKSASGRACEKFWICGISRSVRWKTIPSQVGKQKKIPLTQPVKYFTFPPFVHFFLTRGHFIGHNLLLARDAADGLPALVGHVANLWVINGGVCVRVCACVCVRGCVRACVTV